MSEFSKRRMLITMAHPDDESFGLGGVIGKYVAQGVDVYYACATNGDVGTVSPELLNGYNSVSELRLAELDRASEILKFKHVFKLGYKDSGMMGSETCQDPECLWYRWNNHPDDVTRRFVEIIREVQPQVIVTFNKYGGYGHPDHIAVHRATMRAFELAGDPSYETGQMPYKPQKLYYGNVPKWPVRIGVWQMRLKGQDPRKLGRNKDIDILAILENIEPSHTRLDIRDYFDIWDAAGAAHVSQGGGRSIGIVPKRLRRMLTPYQFFTRVYPKPAYNRIDEYDMFANITEDEPARVR